MSLLIYPKEVGLGFPLIIGLKTETVVSCIYLLEIILTQLLLPACCSNRIKDAVFCLCVRGASEQSKAPASAGGFDAGLPRCPEPERQDLGRRR